MLPPPQVVITADPAALRLLLETALNALPQAPPVNWYALKPRERIVLRLIAEGHSTASIAKKRHRSPHTIHSQRAAICRTLGLSGADCLICFAERHRAWLLAQPPISDLKKHQ